MIRSFRLIPASNDSTTYLARPTGICVWIFLAALATGCRTSDGQEIHLPSGEDTGDLMGETPLGDGSRNGNDDNRPDQEQDTGATAEEDTGATPLVDDAAVEWIDLPTEMNCGSTFVASVKMRNTGESTWTRDAGFKLGAVNDSDFLYGPDTRVWISEGISIRPGETYIFDFLLTAPHTESVYLTDWQMVHESVRWFGESTSEAVNVTCVVEETVCDPLTGNGLESGFADKDIRGGSFSSAGWQTTGGQDRLRLALDSPVSGSGVLEIDVTNFDPVSQYSRNKHQIINMYTSDNGSQDVFHTNESWWNIRTGTNYGTGFKFLAAPNGGDSREEVRLIPSASWNLSDTHTFRVEWDSQNVTVSLDGTQLQTLGFHGSVEPLGHIFIGKDNVYDGQVGPFYSNLCVTQLP